MLECVPNAATSKYVLNCLEHHMQVTKSDRTETLLELADIWPAKRRRWWTVIVRDYIGRIQLPPFPKSQIEPTIACLFPYFLPLTGQELEELILTEHERKMFEQYGKGIGGQLVDKNKPCPTALHAWAINVFHVHAIVGDHSVKRGWQNKDCTEQSCMSQINLPTEI